MRCVDAGLRLPKAAYDKISLLHMKAGIVTLLIIFIAGVCRGQDCKGIGRLLPSRSLQLGKKIPAELYNCAGFPAGNARQSAVVRLEFATLSGSCKSQSRELFSF